MKRRKGFSKIVAVLMTIAMMMSSFSAMFVYAEETDTVTYTQITDLTEISEDDQYAIAVWRYFGGTDADSTNGYLLHSENNGSLRAATADSYATITYADGAIPDTALWTLDGADGQYTIKNVGTQKYLGTDLSMDNDEGVAYTIVSGTSGGYQNFAIAYNNASLRYSNSSGSFSLSSSYPPESAVTGTSACNVTIYKVGTGSGEDNPGGDDNDDPIKPTAHPNEALGPQIFFASDFQGTIAPTNLTRITNSIYNAGVTPELAIWCGDLVDGSVYEDGSDTSQAETAGQITKIENTMQAKWPELDIKYLQGNHDYSGFITDGTMEKTGPIEYDDFIIYILNEDSFPWWQGVDSDYADSAENLKTVQATSDAMEAYFDKLIAEGCDKPVIITAHIPLAWSTRSTTGTTWWSDNVYGNILFDVINTAAKELDIVYLYGHNHSDGYDNYIGGSVNYVGVGDIMRVPNGTIGTDNYTNEVINFTYANAGYIGSVSGNCIPSVSTASIMTIAEDKIIVERYSTTGEYEDGAWEVVRYQTGQPQMGIASTDKSEANPMVGEKETFEVLVSDGLEVVSYEWTLNSDNAVIESGADSNQVTVSYASAGDVYLNCKVTYKPADGSEQSMTESIGVTVDELRLASAATVDTIYYNPSYNQNDKINDGLTNTFWCCWQANAVLENPWASYTFDKNVELTGCVINWYDDGAGAQCPNGLTIEYQDSVGNWVPVTPTSDNYDVFVDGQDNTYEFEKVVTKAIRLVMDNSVSNASVAIREWNLIGQFAGNGSEEPTPTPEPKKELLYAIDCGDIDPTTLSDDAALGAYNSVTDQFYGKDARSGKMWGVVDTAAPNTSYPDLMTGEMTWPAENIGATDTSSKAFTYRYAKDQPVVNSETDGVVYKFELEAGKTYDLELGFFVDSSWTNASNPRTMRLELNGEVVNDNFVASNDSSDPYIIETTATADEEGFLTIQIGHADNAVWGPVVSYIEIVGEEEVDETLLADFDFDEDGEFFDGGNAVATGTYTLVDYAGGKALKLDGDGQFLTVTKKDGTSLLTGVEELTVAFKFNPESSATNWAFFAAPTANQQQYRSEHYLGIFDNNGAIGAERYNSNSQDRPANPSYQMGYGNWYHVVVVFTKETEDASAETILYVNGEEVAREASVIDIKDLLGENSVLYIGKSTWEGGEYATALIDNYTIYSRALTADEIFRGVTKGVDKSALGAAIANAVPEADEEKYTPTTWAAYAEALAAAKEVAANIDATQREVNEATLALTSAQGRLAEKADKSVLTALVAEAKEINTEGKDAELVEDLLKEIEDAEKVLANADARQVAVDSAVKQLQNAVDAIKAEPEPTPTPVPKKLPYEDVTEADWFYEAVAYTYWEGLMTGMDPTHFGPYNQLSRAQFALILYRIEGEPAVETEKSFGDITGDEWYGQAVLWAAEAGIVSGYLDGNFGPADNITREQMAVMMYRYAGYLGKETTNEGDFSAFKDAASVSEFAVDAMKWATAKQIITGKEEGTMIDPQGNTARCEAAAIIQRFME